MFRRLKNLWKISALDIYPNGIYEVAKPFMAIGKDIGYEYEGKPKGVIIKKDNLEEVLDEIIK